MSNRGAKLDGKGVYAAAKQQLASIYEKTVKRKKKKEEEKPVTKRYRLVCDFAIMEDCERKVYQHYYFLPKAQAYKEKDRLYSIYEAAMLTHNVIYFEKCFVEIITETD